MSELNQLLRQAHRIMGGNSPRTSRSEEDAKHLTGAGVPDATKVTALVEDDDVKPKAASRKKADPSPNVQGDFADESHKDDPIYQTIYETDKSKAASRRKKAEFPPVGDGDGDHDDAPAAEPKENPFGGDEAGAKEGCDDGGCTNADIVEAMEDVKQGIEDAKVEAGDGPAADLLTALEEVINAVDSIQDAVSEDAMGDPAAQDAFKTAAVFKDFFIKQRNIKAAKVIREKLAAHEASMQKPAEKPKTAAVKRAFDPRVLKTK